MPTKSDLLVSNLQESVKGLQTFMLSALGAALFFILLVFSPQKEISVQAPAFGSTLPVSISVAVALALSVYWLSGFMATLLVARANRLVHALREESPELVEAVLLYPSVVTLRVYGPRQALAILPAVLVVIGSIRWWGSQLLSYWPVVGVVLLALPSIVLVLQLRASIGGFAPSHWGD